MKKNYEVNQLIITVSFLFIIISVIILIELLKTRYRTYKKIDSIVLTENYLESIILNDEYKLLRGSNHVYIDNKRYKVKIIEVSRNILKRKGKYYHQVIMRVDFPKKYKDNDYINLTIYNKKEKIINMFKTCWKEVKWKK